MTRPSGARWSSPGRRRRLPRAVGGLEDGVQPVGCGLVRAHDPERRRVRPHDVAEERAEHARRLAGGARRRVDRHRVVGEVGQLEVLRQPAAVRVRVRAHAAVAVGGERRELAPQRAVLVEERLRVVAAHPGLEQPHVLGVVREPGQRHLVRVERALDLARRRRPWAPSSPSACAGRSSASAGGRRARRRGRAPGWRRSRRGSRRAPRPSPGAPRRGRRPRRSAARARSPAAGW